MQREDSGSDSGGGAIFYIAQITAQQNFEVTQN